METVLRVIFVYVLVWGCFRVLGKRELTQMSPFELVTLLFIPQLFSRALTRQDYSMTNAVIGATTLFTLVFLTSAASYRSQRFARVVQARPRSSLGPGGAPARPPRRRCGRRPVARPPPVGAEPAAHVPVPVL